MKVAVYKDNYRAQEKSNGNYQELNLDVISIDWGCSIEDIQVYEFDGVSTDLPFAKVVGSELVVDQEEKQAMMLNNAKTLAIESVEEYAEQMREKFTDGAMTRKLDGYQINSDILNLMDAGVSFENLDPYLQQKVNVEVQTDVRFSTKEELFEIWRSRRGVMTVGTAWIDALEKNTISSIDSLDDIASIPGVIESSKETAETKLGELLGGQVQ